MPKTSLLKKIGTRVVRGKEKIESAIRAQSAVIDPFNNLSQAAAPISPAMSTMTKVLIPFRLVGLLSAPFEFASIRKEIKSAIKAPAELKCLPLLKIASSSGTILDQIASAAGICETIGITGIEALMAAATPIGVVASGLQAAGIAISSWRIHALNQQWKKVERLLKEKPENNDNKVEKYAKAVSFLVDEPESTREKFRNKFFGAFNKKQKELTEKIFKACIKTEDEIKMQATFQDLKKHVICKKIKEAIAIALLIIGIVGALALAFSPLLLLLLDGAFWPFLAGPL